MSKAYFSEMSWTCRSWWSNTKISYPTLISGVCELWGWKPKKMKISYPSLNSGTLWIFDGLKHKRIIIWIKKLCHQSALKNEYVSSGVGANCLIGWQPSKPCVEITWFILSWFFLSKAHPQDLFHNCSFDLTISEKLNFARYLTLFWLYFDLILTLFWKK